MSDLVFLGLLFFGCYVAGIVSCFVALVWIGRGMKGEPPPPSQSVMIVRHDVHHHGLPVDDDDGEAWKRARDE